MPSSALSAVLYVVFWRKNSRNENGADKKCAFLTKNARAFARGAVGRSYTCKHRIDKACRPLNKNEFIEIGTLF